MVVVRFNLSHRRNVEPLVEDLLAQRDIIVSRKSIRLLGVINYYETKKFSRNGHQADIQHSMVSDATSPSG
ncbi:MAG: hypothetical protein ACI9SX_001231 [Pseudoalteromonas tetraodonis]